LTFSTAEPARFDLSPGSYAPKARFRFVRVLGTQPAAGAENGSINDIAGHYQEVYKAVQGRDIPNSRTEYACGPFFSSSCTIRKSHRAETHLGDPLGAYYTATTVGRDSSKSAGARCEKHVREILKLCWIIHPPSAHPACHELTFIRFVPAAINFDEIGTGQVSGGNRSWIAALAWKEFRYAGGLSGQGESLPVMGCRRPSSLAEMESVSR